MSSRSENDLIRRGDVLELLYKFKEDKDCPKNYGTLLTIISRTWEMPKAYDMDAVAKQIERSMDKLSDGMCSLWDKGGVLGGKKRIRLFCQKLSKGITEIVKEGGGSDETD